ncbi:hypothetical protein [Microlunatus ginsengisoli]|uniref:DUF5655 domain-containing protein n=1 Tax=Microlunatus ginsengisoli TaxID=363863 RepID=A0ABP7ASP2_9ACTN
MDQLADLEAQLQRWSVPSDVRDALRSAVDAVARQGVDLVGEAGDDRLSVGVRDKPVAVSFSSSRVSVALEPVDAERAHRADSAIGLDKVDQSSWVVHCRYGRLDSSRLNSMAALMVKALRRFAPAPAPAARAVAPRSPRKRAAKAATAPSPRTAAARQEERREAAAAAIPRCPVPGCNLPMVGGSCGFHD